MPTCTSWGKKSWCSKAALSDEAGHYGPGTYLKNPPGSFHAPYSEEGCLLFVKLRHLDPADTERCVVDTRSANWFQGMVPGLTVLPLSEFGTQHTAMVRWAPGTFFNPHRHFGGEEIFVVEGVFSDEHGSYPQGSWIRSPHLSQHQPFQPRRLPDSGENRAPALVATHRSPNTPPTHNPDHIHADCPFETHPPIRPLAGAGADWTAGHGHRRTQI
jgi:anti-sigma factor ChrR (cupin superfamily)